MTDINGKELPSAIEPVLAIAKQRVAPEQFALVASFLAGYYDSATTRQLGTEAPDDLYGAALAHWNLASSRMRGTPRIRIYTPQLEHHGWQSSRTIVDIVCDDAPFLVDSLRMAVQSSNVDVHRLRHTTLSITRDASGHAVRIDAEAESSPQTRELVFHCEIDRLADADQIDALKSRCEAVIAAVDTAVADWPEMLKGIADARASLIATKRYIDARDVDEGIALLDWMAEGHFTLLGYERYGRTANNAFLKLEPDSGLGLLRPQTRLKQHRRVTAGSIEQPTDRPVVVTKGDSKSQIHRRAYHDYIAVRQVDETGSIVAEHVFIGLFTSTSYNSSVMQVPWIRAKAQQILARAPVRADSHSARTMLNALETHPRDELFHANTDELYETLSGVIDAQERQRVAVFVNREPFGRFVSCLVLIPRDRFNTQVRNKVRQLLETEFSATDTEFSVHLSDMRLARVNFVLRVDSYAADAHAAYADLEERIRAATRSWTDDLASAVLDHFGDAHGAALVRRYVNAFGADYQQRYSSRVAVSDIERMQQLQDSADELAMTLNRPLEASRDRIHLKLFHPGAPVPLSAILEILENMGLRVDEAHPSRVEPEGTRSVWIHDFTMTHSEGEDFDTEAVADRFRAAFLRVWDGAAENDAFNHLVLRAGLSWREVVVLRAYGRYLKQVGITFSQEYMQQTLSANPTIARSLVELFHARFKPETADGDLAKALSQRVLTALDDVQSLDEDRILRSFHAVINATLRTNFYQTDAAGDRKSYVSLKLDPQLVPDLPRPKPKFEIFVYSPRVEGIHLRGGPIARGGLRWSDRREDFRTEVLGLMKAQMIKNAVIVPIGAKGGFVPKHLDDCADRAEEGKECYRIFVRGLLDLTDNYQGRDVVPPPQVVRHDGDDPYLVVAADKGTATFSDIANALSAEYGFWLGDGFASGGSVGYDHKAMGITARGAWESVKRHFREIGTDTQTTPFTAVGIGDMAGDVFGNGMLRSDKMKLVAAFNHAHIFLDPDPDPALSFAERKRLYALPRSSWSDYNTDLISTGGGIYLRSAKSIKISPQVRAALRIDEDQLAPSALIQAILKAPVDLLWNGGIGTYVKARSEGHDAAGDRANDSVRINGDELRCKVVGEGGNLGFTQRGRIEYASNGGRLNTDSIDNSAGVDCSDHEVNIKILLNQLVHEGDMTLKQRNELLAAMTNEVGELVLRTNYLQSQTLTLAAAQAPSMLDVHSRLIAKLEQARRFDRSVEHLPDVEAVEQRHKAGLGLTRPELSVLIGHVKLALFDEMLRSDLPETPFFMSELLAYFPSMLRERFADRMPEHRLAREIISNVVVNEIVNHAGITFVYRMQEETGANIADVARAYYMAREIFNQREMRRDIEELDNVADANMQTALLLECRKLVERAARWLLRSCQPMLDINAGVDRFARGIAELVKDFQRIVDDETRAAIVARAEQLSASGVPHDITDRVATYDELVAGLDMIDVAHAAEQPIRDAGAVYFQVSAAIGLRWLRESINALPRASRWQTLARTALREDLNLQHREITALALQWSEPHESAEKRVASWAAAQGAATPRCIDFMQELHREAIIDSAMLSAALREIRHLNREPAALRHDAEAEAKADVRAKTARVR